MRKLLSNAQEKHIIRLHKGLSVRQLAFVYPSFSDDDDEDKCDIIIP